MSYLVARDEHSLTVDVAEKRFQSAFVFLLFEN